MDYLNSDCVLRKVLEEKKSLTGFLDAVFGFLCRNTDFYHVQKSKDDKIGFPKGIKEQILMNCMLKYEHTFGQEGDRVVDDPPVAVEEVEVVTEEIPVLSNGYEEATTNGTNIKMTKSVSDVESSDNNKIFNESDYKNGSVFENYCWSQTLNDVELVVILPKEVKSAKHVKLDLKSNYINIKALLPNEQTVISEKTWNKYKHNDAVWTITDGKLQLNFEKLRECWWDKLFITEAAIDIKKVDTDRPIHEYSEETRNAIEKIHLEHWQEGVKSPSLPLSEREKLERLRQAWNIKGSPFKGQPFDPSLVTFT